MKKTKKIVIVIALAAIIIIASVFATFAIWTTMPSASVLFEMGVINENPSLKYQLFVPVDVDNKRIKGTYNFLTKIYTLNTPSDIINIEGLALVGYEGGIALDHLEVPDTFLYNIDGVEDIYSVISIIVDTEYREFYFRGNTVIKTISIPQNVTDIANGAFMGMDNLTTLTYRGTGNIVVGDYAFADCSKLSNPQTPEGRVIVGR